MEKSSTLSKPRHQMQMFDNLATIHWGKQPPEHWALTEVGVEAFIRDKPLLLL
jgi:hypothetical protein